MEARQLDLCRYRLEKAKDELSTSELILKNKKFSQSINRSYYSIFHAVRALLALEKIDSVKHSGVISRFALHFVKTGKIEREYSKMLTTAFKIRNDCDYSDFYVAAYEDAKMQFENASKFIKRIEEYIKSIDISIKDDSNRGER
ncbi:MAG: HEPN domain-containing protein [Candidatus Aminicenantes bacterium]|nr:HEPN domain-containing protein [Candidatus Aminicenantes bacterium]